MDVGFGFGNLSFCSEIWGFGRGLILIPSQVKMEIQEVTHQNTLSSVKGPLLGFIFRGFDV